MTVHLIFVYYFNLNEDKPLFIYINLLFLCESEFVQSEKIREKSAKREGFEENLVKSWKVMEFFRSLQKVLFFLPSQEIF